MEHPTPEVEIPKAKAVLPDLPAAVKTPKKGLVSQYKLLIIVGAVILVVLIFLMLFMRNRSRKLKEQLQRQRRQEMHSQSSQDAAQLAQSYAGYGYDYPPGLFYNNNEQQEEVHTVPVAEQQRAQQQRHQQQRQQSAQQQQPPVTAIPAPMPEPECEGGTCANPATTAPAHQPSRPAQQPPQQQIHPAVLVGGRASGVVPSPAGIVRELPDEPPRAAIPEVSIPAPPPSMVNVPEGMPPLDDDPFLTRIEQPPPVPEPVPQPRALQQGFLIDTAELGTDPFSPVAAAVPAAFEINDEVPPVTEIPLVVE